MSWGRKKKKEGEKRGLGVAQDKPDKPNSQKKKKERKRKKSEHRVTFFEGENRGM